MAVKKPLDRRDRTRTLSGPTDDPQRRRSKGDVVGYWPAGHRGDKQLFVRYREPSSQGHGDLWVDLSSLSDDVDDLAKVAPYSGSVASGSAVELDDGRVLYVWSEGTSIRQGHSDDVDTFLSTDGSVTEDRVLHSDLTRSGGGSGYGACAVSRSAGRLLLGTWWWSKGGDDVARGRVYESSDEGGSWALLAELDTLDISGFTLYEPDVAIVGPVRTLDSGTLIFIGCKAATDRLDYDETAPNQTVWRSTDGGESWSVAFELEGLTQSIYNNHPTRTLGGDEDDLYFSYYHSGSTDETRIYRSTDYGQTWSLINEISAGAFSDSDASVSVTPDHRDLSGYRVVVAGGNGEIQRWLAPELSDPVSEWEKVGDLADWGLPNADIHDYLLQTIGGIRAWFADGYVASSAVAKLGQAIWKVWTDAGEWAEVGSQTILDHDHPEYAPSGHDHDGDYADKGHDHDADYADAVHTHPLTEVEQSSAADLDVARWDGGAGEWQADDLSDKAEQSDLDAHTGDTDNPHSVTHAQAGAPTGNPHDVTAAEVGAVADAGSTPQDQADTRANQPGADTVAVGSRYWVTDELVYERSDGSVWEAVEAEAADHTHLMEEVSGRAARVYLGSAQSIANSTWEKVAVDSVTDDPDGLFDSANNQIVADRDGWWLVLVGVGLGGSSSDRGFAAIGHNGSRVARANSIASGTVPVADAVKVAAGDTFEGQAWQDSGGSLDLQTFEARTWLSAVYLGRP